MVYSRNSFLTLLYMGRGNEKMKKFLNSKNAKLILSAIVIVVLIVPFWIFKVNNNKNVLQLENKDVFAHMEPGIIEEETFGNLRMSNISMITDNGYTTFTADVTNTGDDALDFENINIEFRDENDSVVVVLLGNIGSDLKPNETRILSATAKGEFKNVSSKSLVAYEG